MIKDPQAKLDYKWDWTAWLAGDTIASATVTGPDGITISDVSHDTTTVTAWVAGGTLKTRYGLVCHVVTAGGREDDRTLTLQIEDK